MRICVKSIEVIVSYDSYGMIRFHEQFIGNKN